MEVWEDRERASGRRIGIRFVVIPGTGAGRAREAIVPLAGGPGQDATGSAGGVARMLAGAREGRDLLFMDHRGTGGSNPLPCEISVPGNLQSYLVEFFTTEGVARCARALAPRADVRLYTSAHAAGDLEQLRAALGYERLDLFGGSYGTRTALVYLRRHPERVRSVLMQGAVPTDIRYPLTVAPDAQMAIDGVFADCARDARCRADFSDPAADLRTSLRRLDAGPVEARVVSPLTGEVSTVRLSRERFTEALRYMTYGPAASSLVPVVLHHAARGDFGPAAEQALYWRMGLVSASSRGLYLAVTCPEDVAFADSARAERLARGTYLGSWRVRDQRGACAAWPHDRLDSSFVEPVRSEVPVLVLNGQWDPATASHHAQRMLRTLPNGRLVVIPGAGHGSYGLVGAEACETALMVQFIRTADARGVDASCTERVRRPPFPVSLSAGRGAALDSAALARFAGRYAAPGLDTLVLRVRGGRLRMVFPGEGGEAELIPLAPGRFRRLDTPHVIATFTEREGVVTGFQVADGGAPPEVYTRVGAM